MTTTVEDIRHRWNRAWPAPWRDSTALRSHPLSTDTLIYGPNDKPPIARVFRDHENAVAIAHAPSDVAYLLAEVKRLRTLLYDEDICPDCGKADGPIAGPHGHESRCELRPDGGEVGE